jgi:hypothetical protein
MPTMAPPGGKDGHPFPVPIKALAGVPYAVLELAGSLVAVFVVVTLLASLVVSIKAFWARVAVRALGSWLAATGLLMIGWSLRAGNLN